MQQIKSFEYLFCGNDTGYLNDIQTYFEKKFIYPVFRQITDKDKLCQSLNEKLWDIIFIDDDNTGFDISEILRCITDCKTFTRTILLSERIGPEELVYLMKDGLNNYVKRKDLERLYNVVIDELNDARFVKEENRYRLLRENIKKFEMIKRFAGNVSHSVNNMLMVIINTAVFLSDEKGLSQRQREDIEHIIQTVRKGQDLIQNLLMVASASVMNSGIFEINSLVQTIVNNVKRLTGYNVEMNIERSGVSKEVKGDEHLLSEAFRHIVLFLKDRTDGGVINIRTDVLSLDDGNNLRKAGGLKEGEYLMIEVSGSDKGISPELLEHIFEPYYSESGVWQGASLGLSVSFGIIWEHNGIIDVVSSKGSGTKFMIYLPVYKKDSKEILLPRASEYLPVPRGTVLIVEDDEDVKNVLLRIFGEEGFSVIDAIDGLGALVMLQRKKPSDLVALVTDVIMPKMNGLELAREIRKQYANLKVVFISGFSDESGEIMNFDNSVFIRKPVAREVLMKEVRNFIFGDKEKK